jgi:hypothetical protein
LLNAEIEERFLASLGMTAKTYKQNQEKAQKGKKKTKTCYHLSIARPPALRRGPPFGAAEGGGKFTAQKQ